MKKTGDWVKALGQWHLYRTGGATTTICGMPMLGNNYARTIPEEERKKCEGCFTESNEKGE